MSSLPIPNISKRSDKGVQLFFDTYYNTQINLSDNELSVVIAFFEDAGFDKTAAIAVSTLLLRQAKNESIKVFELLDTLKTLDGKRLSSIVAEILNYNRKRTSVVGFRKLKTTTTIETRNILEGS
jgi:hypothetical protein|tara:strand:+ start:83 stop:457 length:375 start_codon:yes stop_codon:yes gene_type:complete